MTDDRKDPERGRRRHGGPAQHHRPSGALSGALKMTCRNCGHSPDQHSEGICKQATETAMERVECTCPAYNVRPTVAPLTESERQRVLTAQINDLDRQIGALTARRDALTRSLAAAVQPLAS